MPFSHMLSFKNPFKGRPHVIALAQLKSALRGKTCLMSICPIVHKVTRHGHCPYKPQSMLSC